MTLDYLVVIEFGFLFKIISSITGLFGGGDDKGGIINSTNDSILGDNAVIDSTLDDIKDKVSSDENEGFFDKIVNFFKDLFGGSETDDAEDADLEPAEPQSTDDGSLPEDDPEDPENPNNISGQKAGEESGEDGGLEEDIPEDGQADEEDVSDGSDVSE